MLENLYVKWYDGMTIRPLISRRD